MVRSLRYRDILTEALKTNYEDSEEPGPYRELIQHGILREIGEERENRSDDLVPLGLQNRCRMWKLIRDIEKMDKIERLEPSIFSPIGCLEKPRTLHLSSNLEHVGEPVTGSQS